MAEWRLVGSSQIGSTSIEICSGPSQLPARGWAEDWYADAFA